MLNAYYKIYVCLANEPLEKIRILQCIVVINNKYYIRILGEEKPASTATYIEY